MFEKYNSENGRVFNDGRSKAFVPLTTNPYIMGGIQHGDFWHQPNQLPPIEESVRPFLPIVEILSPLYSLLFSTVVDDIFYLYLMEGNNIILLNQYNTEFKNIDKSKLPRLSPSTFPNSGTVPPSQLVEGELTYSRDLKTGSYTSTLIPENSALTDVNIDVNILSYFLPGYYKVKAGNEISISLNETPNPQSITFYRGIANSSIFDGNQFYEFATYSENKFSIETDFNDDSQTEYTVPEDSLWGFRQIEQYNTVQHFRNFAVQGDEGNFVLQYDYVEQQLDISHYPATYISRTSSLRFISVMYINQDGFASVDYYTISNNLESTKQTYSIPGDTFIPSYFLLGSEIYNNINFNNLDYRKNILTEFDSFDGDHIQSSISYPLYDGTNLNDRSEIFIEDFESLSTTLTSGQAVVLNLLKNNLFSKEIIISPIPDDIDTSNIFIHALISRE